MLLERIKVKWIIYMTGRQKLIYKEEKKREMNKIQKRKLIKIKIIKIKMKKLNQIKMIKWIE